MSGLFLPAWMDLCSESAMAEKLGIELSALLKEIKELRLSYSVHSSYSGAGFQFTRAMMEHNLQIWECVRAGGHEFELETFRDEAETRGVYKCVNCPAKSYH
jgi:hypothetical protein